MKRQTFTIEQLQEIQRQTRSGKKNDGKSLSVAQAGQESPAERLEREARRIEFAVFGTPLGKPRMTRQDKWKKRPPVVRYRAWSDELRLAAGKLPSADAVESVRITAYFQPPVSRDKRRRVLDLGSPHRQVPDCDNVAKAVLDSLWPLDDSGIAKLSIEKKWGVESAIKIVIIYR